MLAAVVQLATNVGILSRGIAAVTKANQDNRKNIRWVAAGFLFDILLTVGLSFGLLQSHSADVAARDARKELVSQQVVLEKQTKDLAVQTKALGTAQRTAKEALHANCISANEARAVNLALWNSVLNAPPTFPRSHAAQVQIDKFKTLVADAYRQRDCDKA